jgi:hypothetical protein
MTLKSGWRPSGTAAAPRYPTVFADAEAPAMAVDPLSIHY